MKKSKKITLLSVLFIAVVACLLMAAGQARASAYQDKGGPIVLSPFGVERIDDRIGVFNLEDGHICVVAYKGELYEPEITCYCPCDITYVTEYIETECEECEPEVIELPCPPDVPKCNSGRGNGSEGLPDCDPGNSGGHNNGGD